MKKLLLILSAILVSVISLGQSVDPNSGWPHLNPFAYDLKSEVKNDGTIDLIFSLNANAIPSDGGGKTYEKLNNESRGVQIYILDEHETVVHTIPVPSTKINKGTHTINLSYNDIPKAYWGKPLSWEVTVWGNKGRTEQKQILDYTAINTASGFYPKNVHGIAIEKNPNNPHFGKIFISEACTTSTPGKNSLLEYDMLLKYQGFHHKDYVQNNSGIADSHFSKTVNYEPHRVKISEDGRIFVTCYHPTASHAVLEYMGSGIYKSIIKCKGGKVSEGGNIDDNNDAPVGWGYGPDEKYNRRPIAMDVIGRGNDLKIIVAWISPKGWYPTNNKGNWRSQVEIIEYAVGENGCDIMQDEGTIVATWKDKASNDANAGYLFQQYYNVGTTKSVPAATHGFVDISYDNDGDIWLKVDYAYNKDWEGEVYLFKREENDTKKEHDYLYSFSNNGILSYGANGICIIKNKNDQYELFTGSATNQIAKFTINKNTSPVISNMNTYTQTADGSLRVVGIAEDYAGNLYILNNRGDETNDDNVVVFAMPYDGKRVTRSQTTFNVSVPIPNILATDLRFAPVPNQPKYRFSFNVNTTPEIAQIRFYKSYGDGGENDMKKNLAKINADDYQEGNAIEPSFVYNIPERFLKQGEISVSLGMCGGKLSGEIGSKDCKITNDSLPRGEWYWSVYVEAPRKSTRFAPIYKQGSTGEDTHCRLHATINNYPETDQFGWIIAAQYDTRAGSAKKGLMLYGFNPTGNSNDEQSTINNNVRYKLIKEYINPTTGTNKFENQRRLAVAPDGKVFIADYGNTNNDTRPLSSVMPFKNGGIWLWDPAKQSESSNTINLSLFLNSTTETANGLAIYKDYNDETKIKLYGTNTYGEFEYHGKYYEPAAQEVNGTFGKNGIKEYELGKPENIYQKETQNTITRQLGAGDGNGNISIVTMDKGIWIAQHRLNDVQYALDQFKSGKETNLALPDNPANYILSFVPYNSSTRTWTSCSSNGVSFSASNRTYEFKADASDLTQKTTSPLQSCPGAGLAYRKITAGSQKGEYLYIVNHEGNIVELQITSWDGNKPTVVYKKTLPSAGNKIDIPGTTRKTGAISTINFDYAGNLITTSGTEYLGSASQDIIVYTMPYDRKNAREIQAPNSCRFIPERTAYLEPRSEMVLTLQPYIDGGKSCYLDIFRPMPNTSFSTICLPFDLDMKQLTTEALKDAEVKRYIGLQLSDIGGEQMLELVFEDVPTEDGKQILIANTPYIIQPKVRIPGIIQLQTPIQFVTIDEKSIENADNEYAITFKGVIPTQQIEVNQPLTLLLVAENRLAEMVPDEGTTGMIYGFRGYFELNKPLNGIAARITPKQSVSTSTTIIVDGKRVNIEKYLREGRVYIRVGDSLYTMDGQKVE